MAKYNRTRAFGQTILGLLIAVGLVVVVSGCKKEEPAQQAPAEQPRAEAPQPSSFNEEMAEIPEPSTGLFGGPKVRLDEIIRGARTWGPTFSMWIDKSAPDFVLPDIIGTQHRLSDYRGKNVMIVFWAPWCAPCKLEVPDLIELQNTIGQDKLAILSVSYISPINSFTMIKDFVTEYNVNYTVLAVKQTDVPEPYSMVEAIPCSFFIDPKGRIKLATLGVVPLSDMRAIIQAE